MTSTAACGSKTEYVRYTTGKAANWGAWSAARSVQLTALPSDGFCALQQPSDVLLGAQCPRAQHCMVPLSEIQGFTQPDTGFMNKSVYTGRCSGILEDDGHEWNRRKRV